MGPEPLMLRPEPSVHGTGVIRTAVVGGVT
jgi:hypothetical protein